jgi:hypothetical protein
VMGTCPRARDKPPSVAAMKHRFKTVMRSPYSKENP